MINIMSERSWNLGEKGWVHVGRLRAYMSEK